MEGGWLGVGLGAGSGPGRPPARGGGWERVSSLRILSETLRMGREMVAAVPGAIGGGAGRTARRCADFESRAGDPVSLWGLNLEAGTAVAAVIPAVAAGMAGTTPGRHGCPLVPRLFLCFMR